ncbi:MAG: hypothetical protein FIB01_14525 [Gemmatimonadetes bacterium]|nr:hypothetical protein [Gemmatimonadota bacterium]
MTIPIRYAGAGARRPRPMRALALLALLACARPVALGAQGASLRLGLGPAYAASPGATALAALEVERGPFLIRGEARGTTTGRSADWEESARVLGAGIAGGLALKPVAGIARPYVLVTASEGLDPREGDRVRSLGAAAGSGLGPGGRLFAELRYERWWQHDVVHHELPRHLLAAVLGLRIH